MPRVHFRNGDQEFVAQGVDVQRLRVAEIEGGEVIPTGLMYPTCLKFMPYAEILDQRGFEASVQKSITLSRLLMKAPPGPPPRPGLEWREETSRWIRPKTGKVKKVESPVTSVTRPIVREYPNGLVSLQAHREGTGVGSTEWTEAWELAQLRASEFDARRAPSFVNRREVEGIQRYTNIGAWNINKYLRGEMTDLQLVDREALEELTEKMRPMGEPQVTYRGTVQADLWNSQVGDVRPVDAFMSTARSPIVAGGFLVDTVASEGEEVEGLVLLEVHSMPGTRGITLDTIETETIYDRDQELQVQYVSRQELRDRGLLQKWGIEEPIVVMFVVATITPRAS